MLTNPLRPFSRLACKLACILLAVPAFAQAPAPSSVRVVSSNKNTIEVEVSDSDGIAWVDVRYGKLPHITACREFAAGCPKTFRITIPRTRRFLLRSEPFFGLAAIDCSSNANGAFVVTHLRMDASGAFKVNGTPHRRTQSEQRLLDWAAMDGMRKEVLDLLLKIVLMLLLLILAMLIAIWWAMRKALGPMLRPRTD